jgi:hypothetical protein
MFFKKKDNRRETAEKLVKLTALQETLDILKREKSAVTAEPEDELVIILAVGTCNLMQTMRADFISQSIDAEAQDEIIRHFVEESLRRQDLVKIKGSSGMETKRFAVMAIVEELQKFWKGEDDQQGSGPGPRYYCVKEMLRRLGAKPGTDLHDALFELMYIRHKYYIDFFKALLAQPKQ